MNPLEALTPLDGRYRDKLSKMEDYFSEYALLRERVKVEIEYLIKLVEEVESEKIKFLPNEWRDILRRIYRDFSKEEVEKVKEIEKTVGHDVFAVVKHLMDKLKSLELGILEPYVHLGLTSEDINNIGYST